MSILVIIEDHERKTYKNVYACCKGECDNILKHSKVYGSLIDGWKDISDLNNPILFMKQIMGTINLLNDGWTFEQTALENLKQIYLACAQNVLREPTEKERKIAEDSSMFEF